MMNFHIVKHETSPIFQKSMDKHRNFVSIVIMLNKSIYKIILLPQFIFVGVSSRGIVVDVSQNTTATSFNRKERRRIIIHGKKRDERKNTYKKTN